jgi:hypothetical protein
MLKKKNKIGDFMEEMTLIPIKKTTREKLRNIGTKKDTYDTLINTLISKM